MKNEYKEIHSIPFIMSVSTIEIIKDTIKDFETKFFVDIGASNIEAESQTEVLIKYGWKGIMFEIDPPKANDLRKRLNNPDIIVICDKVTPNNILEHLQDFNVPNDFFLSLDIDSYDYFILEKILEKYSPSCIITEINEKIPPPLKFTVLYNEDYKWDESHCYGYSLSMLEDLLYKYNYNIAFLHMNNAVLTPGKQEESMTEVYNKGYYNNPDKYSLFHWNYNIDVINTLALEEQKKFLNKYFHKYSGRYLLL
jgi:hypothetical protein